MRRAKVEGDLNIEKADKIAAEKRARIETRGEGGTKKRVQRKETG